MPSRPAWALAALAIAPAPLHAQAAERVLAPFNACRPVADVRARAACYDAALDKLRGQVSERQVVIVDRQQAAVDRKTLFGFGGGDRRAVLPSAPPEPPVVALDSSVSAARSIGYDRWSVRLATGATWRTTESLAALDPKPGQPVKIRRGIMNSYTMKVGRARAVKATRVN